MSKKTWQQLSRMFFVAAIVPVCLPTAVRADDQDRREERREARQDDRKLKIFELKHIKPQELVQVLMMQRFIAAAEQREEQRIHPTAQQQQQPVRPQAQQAQPPHTQQPSRTIHATGADGLVMTFDPEEKLLFVRGPEDKVNKVEELVNAFDVSKDELEKKKFGGMTLIPVRKDKARQVSRTLAHLQLEGRVITMGDAALVVLRGEDTEDERIKQARQVIEKYEASQIRTQDTEDATNDTDNNNNRD
jgi:type II secretory pathway component GspD/PulD (secretin)